jgi:hypothetical protein
LLRSLDRIRDFLLARLPHRIVQLLGQERLALLCILHVAAHLFEQLVEPLFLPVKALAYLLSFARVAQRVLLSLLPGFELLGKFLLILAELTGLVAHVRCFLGEPIGRVLPQVFPHVVQFAAGACALRQGLR